jgi:hypothetical protein
MRDTLGWKGVNQSVTKYHMGGEACDNFIGNFTSKSKLKPLSHHPGRRKLNVTLGEERGIKSVAYFLNGPLYQTKTTQYFQHLTNK